MAGGRGLNLLPAWTHEPLMPHTNGVCGTHGWGIMVGREKTGQMTLGRFFDEIQADVVGFVRLRLARCEELE